MKVDGDIFARAAWRLIPFVMLLYVVSFLDRVNVSFAALTMNDDLGFSAEVYGFGAGVFFLGYFLFEMPSNLILEKVGARLWICRIMVTWGLISMGMAFVQGQTGFFILRFLLGVAEAGFFPGILLYLTYWFPKRMQAKFIAMFLAAVPLASVIGSPISGIILGLDGLHGLKGWQWLFLLEGAPSVLLGLVVLALLPDGPSTAPWLNNDEKDLIATNLKADPPAHVHGLVPMLLDTRVWLLMIPDFGIVLSLYGLGLWLPQIVNAMGFSVLQTGFIVALPYLVAMFAMVMLGMSSDKREERLFHTSAAAVAAAVGFLIAALSPSTVMQLIGLTIAAAGIYAALAVFWTLPPSFLGGTAAAGGIGLINSVANLGGFVGPTLMGWMLTLTGNYTAGMEMLAVILILSAGLVIVVGRRLGVATSAARR